jgi:hypothetical protein
MDPEEVVLAVWIVEVVASEFGSLMAGRGESSLLRGCFKENVVKVPPLLP